MLSKIRKRTTTIMSDLWQIPPVLQSCGSRKPHDQKACVRSLLRSAALRRDQIQGERPTSMSVVSEDRQGPLQARMVEGTARHTQRHECRVTDCTATMDECYGALASLGALFPSGLSTAITLELGTKHATRCSSMEYGCRPPKQQQLSPDATTSRLRALQS